MMGLLFVASFFIVGTIAAIKSGTVHGGKSNLASASGCSKCDNDRSAPCTTCTAE